MRNDENGEPVDFTLKEYKEVRVRVRVRIRVRVIPFFYYLPFSH
jgi:hypothetical protein